MTTKQITLWSAVVCVAVAGLLPLCVMLAKSLTVDQNFSFENYSRLFDSGRQWGLLRNSLTLSLSVTLLVTIIGVPLGLLLGKTDLPFRRGFLVFFSIPLVMPPYILAVSWTEVLGREGTLTRLFGTGVGAITSDWLFSLGGTVLVLVTIFLPIMVLLTIVFLRSIDPMLEQAGRIVSGWYHVLRYVTLPLIFPGLVLAAALVFLLGLGEFSVPSYLRLGVYSVESFTQFAAFYNFGAATAAAVPLVLIVLLVLFFERIAIGEPSRLLRPSGEHELSPIISLGRYRLWILIMVALLGLMIIIVPFAQLLLQALSGGKMIEAVNRSADSLVRSLLYAALGATGLTVLGFLVGYILSTRGLKPWRSIDALTFFLFVQPGTVIGIGMVSLWNTEWTSAVYGTPVIIILGFVAQYIALSSRIMNVSLSRIPVSMEEAARTVGSGWIRRMTAIILPMSRKGLIAAWLIGFLFCFRDSGITMVVYPPGHDTIPVRTFTLMANNPPSLIAGVCVVTVVVVLVSIVGLGLIFRSGRGAM